MNQISTSSRAAWLNFVLKFISYVKSNFKRMDGLANALFGKMEEFEMNPQTIADGIKKLVDMQKGSRPLRYPLDAIVQGTDEEFISAKAKIKRKWAAKYGFDI